MSLDELKNFKEFENLPHFDANDKDADAPLMPPGYELLSAFTVNEALQWISEGAAPQYVLQSHAAETNDVRYEVLFWLPQNFTAV